ncbi:MAG TPA: hypothetical protein VHV10_05085 [Ktedonobacteraceae bacterium]|nr:hypothetical protein [Ktedonobacteraceae bacterium]
MATNKTIKVGEMSDTGILVTAAREFAKTYGQVKEDWEKVENLYTFYKKEIADKLIKEQLGEDYLLDIEECREYLAGEEEWDAEQRNREAEKMYHSVYESLGVIEG